MSLNERIDKQFGVITATSHKNRLKRILQEVDLNTIQTDAQKTIQVITTMKDARTKLKNITISHSSQLDLLVTIRALQREGILQIEKSQLDAYNNKFKVLADMRQKHKLSNKQTKAQRGRTIDYQTIIKYLQKESYDIDDVIIALYTYFPPRRTEYKNIKYTSTAPQSNDKSNYIYIKGNQVTLSFNDYKTQNKFGMQQFSLSAPDKKYLQTIQKTMKRLALILKSFKKTEGSYLLVNAKNQPYTQATYSRYITNLFLRTFNVNVSIDILRQAFRTYVDNNLSLNILQSDQIAKSMGHSLSTAMQYYKLDIESNTVESADTLDESDLAEELGQYILYKLRNGKLVFKKSLK